MFFTFAVVVDQGTGGGRMVEWWAIGPSVILGLLYFSTMAVGVTSAKCHFSTVIVGVAYIVRMLALMVSLLAGQVVGRLHCLLCVLLPSCHLPTQCFFHLPPEIVLTSFIPIILYILFCLLFYRSANMLATSLKAVIQA